MVKWFTFIRERFNPAAYIPMIFLFTVANGLFFLKLEGASLNWGRCLLTFILMLSFFFRMRLFDEIKDYEVDLKVNPTRPLARGLLSVKEVRTVLFFLIAFELLLAAFLGSNSFLIHVVAIAYSLLMYEEFFLGDFLRPRLTTYAVSHTFVSVLLGLSCGVAISRTSPAYLPLGVFIFALMNWAFFNLFEFARKTFAKSEERESVPSYSNTFGSGGSWILSISQAILGVLIFSSFYSHVLLFLALGIYLLLSLSYVLNPAVKSAKIFRISSAVYLLIHYAILIYILKV